MAESQHRTVETSIREACQAEQWQEAAALGLRTYGDEIYRYLLAVTRSEADAGEVFSGFCESLWVGLPRFRWESSFRTWAYVLARHNWTHFARDPNRRSGRRTPLSDPEVARVAADLRSRTRSFLRSEVKDRLAEARDALAPDDRTLLILRIDRKLPWNDVARIMLDEEEASDEAVARRAAALRKRFERIKGELRAKLRT